MRANELQIGDWMQTKSGLCFRVMQIEGIIEDYVMLEDGSEDFEPIPLTEEILKKNGFAHLMSGICYNIDIDIQGDKDYAVGLTNKGADKGYFHLWWHPHNDGIKCWHMEVCHLPSMSRFGLAFQYLHELQHALRLCGLNELADNFKV